jgi:hypothetical protein
MALGVGLEKEGRSPYPALASGPLKVRNGCQEVRTRLAEFESGGRLRMSVEMLIGSGSA